jgi:ferredoxin--NADP+ reductase
MEYNATVAGRRRVHDDLMILRVRPDAPIPPFAAGQWIAIGLGLWEPPVPGVGAGEVALADRDTLVRRPYSISSSILCDGEPRLLRPGEEGFYEFYITLPREAPRPPLLVARLFALDVGSRLWVDEKPSGQNTLAGVAPEENVLFAATGTGEAPHNRMIWELLSREHRGRLASFVTTRRWADQGYREVHARVARLFPSYRHTGIATREPGEPGRRLQDLVASGRLEELCGFDFDPAKTRIFLCGNTAMIGAARLQDGKVVPPSPSGMVALLESRGFRADPRRGKINIHFERY